jgi:XrtJ-associated TM-motif-TM protein
MKDALLFLLLALVLLVPHPAHAQGGCDDSPESPTLALAALATAAYGIAGLLAHLRNRASNVGAELTLRGKMYLP